MADAIRKNPRIVGSSHLEGFIPGLIALGAHMLPERETDMDLAKGLMSHFLKLSNSTALGLARDNVREPNYLLRPEVCIHSSKICFLPFPYSPFQIIESLFVLWRVTGDTYYREEGWNLFATMYKYVLLVLLFYF